MPNIGESQPSQSAEVREGPIVKKGQKRTFKKKKDSIGSNLQSLRHEETKAEIVEAASEKDSLPAADEQRVPLPMKVFLSAAEPSSSGPPPLPPPEKQKKPPGRRKSSVSTAPLVEEDGNAMMSQAAETNVTTDGIFSSSPRSSRFRSQPEFQRLSSLAPQKVDKVCHICEQSGDVLIDCQGPCYGSYHLSCLGLVVSPVGSFRCDECSTGTKLIVLYNSSQMAIFKSFILTYTDWLIDCLNSCRQGPVYNYSGRWRQRCCQQTILWQSPRHIQSHTQTLTVMWPWTWSSPKPRPWRWTWLRPWPWKWAWPWKINFADEGFIIKTLFLWAFLLSSIYGLCHFLGFFSFRTFVIVAMEQHSTSFYKFTCFAIFVWINKHMYYLLSTFWKSEVLSLKQYVFI